MKFYWLYNLSDLCELPIFAKLKNKIMKVFKACLVFNILFLLFTVKATAGEPGEFHFIGTQLQLTSTKVDEASLGNQVPRSPMQPLTISIDGNVIYLYGQFEAVTLKLVGAEGVVYTDEIVAGAYETCIPSDLSGSYELQLNDGVGTIKYFV